jgi:hypothetical protein
MLEEAGEMEENTTHYLQFRNMIKILYSHRLMIGVLFVLYIVLQLSFLLGRLKLYWLSWAVTMIPTYAALLAAFILYFYLLIKSKVTLCTLDNFSMFMILAGFLLFALLLSIRLEHPDLMDDAAFLLPPIFFFIGLLFMYAITLMLGLHKHSYANKRSHDLS